MIGHLKQDHRLDRCGLKGTRVDALNAIGAVAGYNLRWWMRWIVFLCVWLRAIVLPPVVVARQTLHAVWKC
ncbi:transposase [Xanthomonas translucens pv. arrhenatheri]|nr:transposase [Xanthomonas translucens pv. arrhenatheri]